MDEQMLKALNDLKARVSHLEQLELITGGAWVIYSSTSTKTGWGSYDAGYPDIYYRVIDNLVFLWFRIEGVSDSTSTSITLPYAVNADIAAIGLCRIMDNGTWATGFFAATAGTSTLNFYATVAGGGWTNSGNKRIQGWLIYKK